MRHSDLSSPSSSTTPTIDFHGTASRLCERYGFIDDARRRETPHIVDIDGLSRTHLTKPGEFEHEFNLRVAWCRRFAPHFEVEPIFSAERRVGRRFRFRDPSIAVLFRGTFPAELG